MTAPRRTGLRPRSSRTARSYPRRRDFVALLLVHRPVCERCCAARSTEVHELRSRARGGSILDPANCAALCHGCHAWITTNPAAATAAGWLRPSWDDTHEEEEEL